LAEVQDMLGHTSLNMTRRYAHLSKGRTAKRMGAILSKVGMDEE
jgi:site-specific recombinase XerD